MNKALIICLLSGSWFTSGSCFAYQMGNYQPPHAHTYNYLNNNYHQQNHGSYHRQNTGYSSPTTPNTTVSGTDVFSDQNEQKQTGINNTQFSNSR